MNSFNKKFYSYPNTRDVLFVFGAGASYSDGAPLQSEIIPIIFSDEFKEIKESDIGKLIIEFMQDNFYVDEDNNYYPNLETIFGFIDYFLTQNEHLNKKYSKTLIHDIRESLIKVIHFVISASANGKSNVYHKFWELVSKYNRNISILTLNYDTLLEESFDFLYPDTSLIDYCIHLMNYDNPPNMEAFNWWDNPREPFRTWEGNPIPIKILKAHGSLNWKYCKCCKQVLLTPWNTAIDLFSGNFLRYDYPNCADPTMESHNYTCPIDDTLFDTLILPPSYIKNLSNPIISQIFTEALKELRYSKRIVFIGYSFPEADVHFKALFQKGMIKDKEIFVIDINNTEEFKNRYRSLSNDIKFMNMSFEDLVNKDNIMKDLLL